MNRNTIITTIFGGAMALGSSNIMAQTAGAEYTSEWQTDFKGGYDWLNLLQLSAQLPVCGALTMEASTLSIAKCADNPLVEDLLTYSNIEAASTVLTISRLGLSLSAGSAELFAGINNVNEDYFVTPLTSVFTNSSCGISPTLSCNYDIANYPLASWCLHWRQALGALSLQSSLYPGRGYVNILGHDNLFSLNLKRDGIFSISSIDYNKNGINTVLGIALYYGQCIGIGEGEQIAAAPSAQKKSFSAAPWLLSEISLPCGLGLLAHGSFSTVSSGCKGYGGAGVVYDSKKVTPGLSVNYASFTDADELNMELTARLPMLSGKAYLQPALHIISTDWASPRLAGLVRFHLCI